MQGQWLGNIEGTTNGFIIINIDHDFPDYGRVYITEDTGNGLIGIICKVSLKKDGKNKYSGILSNFSQFYFSNEQNLPLPLSGTLNGTISNNIFSGGWEVAYKNGNKGIGTINAENNDNSDPSITDNIIYEWDDFRNWATDIKSKFNGAIFRGHSTKKHLLTTSFHRTGRRDLTRYANNDVLQLARFVEGTTGKSYNVNDSKQHAGLLYLSQHHGFPTPFLDWTESPYIAAFFALSRISKKDIKDGFARVYAFNPDTWYEINSTSLVIEDISDPRPYFISLTPQLLGNKRALAQQSTVTATNVVNIEQFINKIEKRNNNANALLKIDIAHSVRNTAMKELEYMGITSANLFPGLDGVCATLKEKLF